MKTVTTALVVLASPASTSRTCSSTRSSTAQDTSAEVTTLIMQADAAVTPRARTTYMTTISEKPTGAITSTSSSSAFSGRSTAADELPWFSWPWGPVGNPAWGSQTGPITTTSAASTSSATAKVTLVARQSVPTPKAVELAATPAATRMWDCLVPFIPGGVEPTHQTNHAMHCGGPTPTSKGVVPDVAVAAVAGDGDDGVDNRWNGRPTEPPMPLPHAGSPDIRPRPLESSSYTSSKRVALTTRF